MDELSPARVTPLAGLIEQTLSLSSRKARSGYPGSSMKFLEDYSFGPGSLRARDDKQLTTIEECGRIGLAGRPVAAEICHQQRGQRCPT